MFHAFKYSLRKMMRSKMTLGWNLMFPIVLATMFSLAFSGLEEDEAFSAIPVAVVTHSESDSELCNVMKEVNDGKMFIVTVLSDEEAAAALEKKDIIGIVYDEAPARLKVSAEMLGNKLEQSILDIFVSEYNLTFSTIMNTVILRPEKAAKISEILSATPEYNEFISYSEGNMQEKLSYFYNLLAMSCLFAASGGVYIATGHQANLTSLGARRCAAPLKRYRSFAGEITAEVLFHFLCVVAALLYINVGLDVDFGPYFGFAFITGFVGTVLGVSFGFMIGSMGRQSEGTKVGIATGSIMICCFLSGLMAGGMRMLVEQIAPWFNRINPAALVTDGFYSLAVYQSFDKYIICLISMAALSVLFWAVGATFTRRRSYAAI